MMRTYIRERAEGVVQRFEEMLPEEVAGQIAREHYEELVLLVEAAIGDVYASTLHDAAKRLEAMAHEFRQAGAVLVEEL